MRVEHPVAVQHNVALHGQHGGCRCKRQAIIERHSALQGAVAAGLQNQRMKTVVHDGVGSITVNTQGASGQQAITFSQAVLQLKLQAARQAMFGYQTGSHALKMPAHSYCICHLTRRELPHKIPPGVVDLHKTLLLQRGQCSANRGTGSPQPLCQLLLGQTLTRLKLSTQN